ncbi:MAG: hypothetical protein NVSMB45_14630 [Ginsengibacter sp.]
MIESTHNDTFLSPTDPIKTGSVTIRKLQGFDDPYFTEEDWMKLLLLNDTHGISLTWKLQRLWWETFGNGELLLLLAEQDDLPVALAPLYANDGMIYNLSPEDRLEFIGNIVDPIILDAILKTARNSVDDFSGFMFYFIPDASPTGQHLVDAAKRLGLECYNKGNIPSPVLEIDRDREHAIVVANKKSLIKYENYFNREGKLEVLHFTKEEEILPYLDDFFNLHISRREITEAKSMFLNTGFRTFYRDLTKLMSSTGWLRFTCLKWNTKPIAFHYGFSYKGRYLYAIPCYDIELSNRSPGKVLLRQLLIAAIAEGASSFDFGIGDEDYKYSFSTNNPTLSHWGLFPP